MIKASLMEGSPFLPELHPRHHELHHSDDELHHSDDEPQSEYEQSCGILPLTIIVVGIALSLHHAFSGRKKERLEKQIMFLFASFVSGFAGIWGGT